MTPPRFYVTTPIYYVNDRPHIGHVYTTTIADIIARYHRLRGREVFFLTGVDEHAAKVSDAAAERGLTAQQWADQNAAAFQDTFTAMGFTHDDFVRTSQDRHKSRVQEYVSALLKSGDVYAGEYEGWYDAGQEEYVTDSKAQEYGHKSPINGKPLVRKKEKNYFFKLEAYRAAVAAAIQSGEFTVEPEARRNEILNRLAEAKDVPISRTGSGGWGIPVPGDPEQTIYVWIDALCNYLTFMDTDSAPDLAAQYGARRKFWDSGAVHLIAKDILWFHAAIWPAFLLALRKCPGYEWVRLPAKVYSHSFWISEGQKMSKTLGNFIDLEKLEHYTATFGLDALRWFLATNGPLGATDSDFAEAKFIEAYNTDLANTLGNCLSRLCNMTGRYFGGKLPAEGPKLVLPPEVRKHLDDSSAHQCTVDLVTAMEGRLPEEALRGRDKLAATAPERFDLALAAQQGLRLVRAIDLYIEATAPFKLAKDPARLPEVGTVLWNCAEAMRIATLLLWPFIPGKVEAAWQRLGCGHYAQALANKGRGDLAAWTRWGQIVPGTAITQGDPLFPRYQAPKA